MTAEITPSVPSHTWRQSAAAAGRVVIARLRFILLLGAIVLLVAIWPTLRNYYDRLTLPTPANAAISSDTEYWCPMCPGVVSEWPTKCPVCHMSLIRRLKGEMTPLPDGVVARVQLSPYRVQLAGVRTSQVDYLPLTDEIVLAGLIEPDSRNGTTGSRWILKADIVDRHAGWLQIGQVVELRCDGAAGGRFTAQIVEIGQRGKSNARFLPVQLEVDDPRRELRSGMYLAGVVRLPLAQQPAHRQLWQEAWRDRSVMDFEGVASLLRSAIDQAALAQGFILTLPESAVIDTGKHQVVFVDRGNGMFDAVPVRLGPRCGANYPLLAGLGPGDHVVTAGALLLDAETRLNPSAAAAYFGAGSRFNSVSSSNLSAEELQLTERQKICPVTDEPLGSMGAPVRVVVDGRVVFVCCEGCTPALKKEPKKYLQKLPKP